MLVLKIALRNLFRRPRRSIILLGIMAGSVFLLFVGNAVLDGTSQGIAESFTKSFTGDLVIRPKDIEAYSLFGNETPVIGELTKLPELAPYKDLGKYISSIPEVYSSAPQLSGVAYLETPGYRMAVPLFGISGPDYFAALPGLAVSRGRQLLAGERGILISEERAAEVLRLTNQKLELGQVLQLTIATDSSFRIRALPIVGFTSYPIKNETLDRIVLLDAATLRSLYGIGSVGSSAIPTSKAETSLLSGSLDDLFGDAAADSQASGTVLDRGRIEAQIEKKSDPALVDSNSGTWNYLLVRLKADVKAESLKKELNTQFTRRGWPVEAILWRDAAGSSALFIYWLKVIFNAGVLIVAFAGLIVIVNALVSGVLERTPEIGTMRALGAQRGFVRRLFSYETGILALISGIIGTALGLAAIALISRKGITLTNPFLIQLFGGPTLKPSWDLAAVGRAVVTSLLIGSIAWIYPVHLALKVEPIEAMRRGE
jgi:ABC-type lipoprotein release transport system permease subunit